MPENARSNKERLNKAKLNKENISKENLNEEKFNEEKLNESRLNKRKLNGEKSNDKTSNEENLNAKNARTLYLQRWRRLERWWAALLLSSLFLLLFYQGWLYFGQTQVLSWLNLPQANWYGADYDEVLPANSAPGAAELWGSVTLEVQNYSELHRAVVLVNGREAGSFAAKQLTLRVYDGDLLEIDCTAYARPVRFQLLKTSVGIDQTRLQTELELCGQRGEIGQINFK